MSNDQCIGRHNLDEATAELQQFGALPWRTNGAGKTRILLVTSRGRERWFIPKVSPLRDRPPVLAASQGAFEKAGIIGDIYPQPVTYYRYIQTLDDGPIKQCCVTVFSMKVYGTLSSWRGQGERKRRWFSVEEAAQKLDDVELAEFIRLHGPLPKGWKLELRSASGSSPTRDHWDLETR